LSNFSSKTFWMALSAEARRTRKIPTSICPPLTEADPSPPQGSVSYFFFNKPDIPTNANPMHTNTMLLH
jgi:hypothetical protein